MEMMAEGVWEGRKDKDREKNGKELRRGKRPGVVVHIRNSLFLFFFPSFFFFLFLFF